VYGDGLRYDDHLHARLASDPDPRPPRDPNSTTFST
jgi:hypothetical protein